MCTEERTSLKGKADMMAVSDFAGLEQRIAKLEEQDRVRHEESTSFTG
jgi:hypothetical protein